MAVYTSYVGNWRGDFEKTISYPNGGQATVNLLCRIDRKGTGTLVNATYTCRIGTTAGGYNIATKTGTLDKAGWTSSGQVRQFAYHPITVTRTHATQTFTYYGSFKYKDSSQESSFHNTGALTVSVAAKTSYIVAFNANGGSGAPANQTKWYGETLTLSSTAPTRTGYTFAGWNAEQNGTGTAYSAGSSYTENAALTLYAQWTVNTYLVSYNANGGSGTMSDSTFTYDTSGTLRTNTFTRTDYIFAGWATSETGAVVYKDGATVTNLAPSGTFPLYAVWKYIYEAPDIQAIDAYRADSHGYEDDAGEYGVISAHVVPAYLYSDLDTKAYTNTQVIASYRLNGSTGSYTQIGSVQTITTADTITWTTASEVFDPANQYDILITARVYVNSTVKTSSILTTFISTAEFTIDFDAEGESIGIFAIAEGAETTGDENKLIYLNGDMVLMLDDDANSGTDYAILTALTTLDWDCSPDV